MKRLTLNHMLIITSHSIFQDCFGYSIFFTFSYLQNKLANSNNGSKIKTTQAGLDSLGSVHSLDQLRVHRFRGNMGNLCACLQFCCEYETSLKIKFIKNGGGMDWEFRISRCKLAHTGCINNKVLLYSTGNYIQYPVINLNEKNQEI